MKNIFWLRKGLIAGRTGPNMDPWNIEDFKDAGFSSILSVNDGEMVHETLIKSIGLEYANIPMSPNAPVRRGDKQFCLNNLPLAVDFIGRNLNNGPVLVHCRSGKDRTGMVLAASLIAIEGINAQESMDEVFKIRSVAFSAQGWVDFGLDVLTEFETQSKSMVMGSLTLKSN